MNKISQPTSIISAQPSAAHVTSPDSRRINPGSVSAIRYGQQGPTPSIGHSTGWAAKALAPLLDPHRPRALSTGVYGEHIQPQSRHSVPELPSLPDWLADAPTAIQKQNYFPILADQTLPQNSISNSKLTAILTKHQDFISSLARPLQPSELFTYLQYIQVCAGQGCLPVDSAGYDRLSSINDELQLAVLESLDWETRDLAIAFLPLVDAYNQGKLSLDDLTYAYIALLKISDQIQPFIPSLINEICLPNLDAEENAEIQLNVLTKIFSEKTTIPKTWEAQNIDLEVLSKQFEYFCTQYQGSNDSADLFGILVLRNKLFDLLITTLDQAKSTFTPENLEKIDRAIETLRNNYRYLMRGERCAVAFVTHQRDILLAVRNGNYSLEDDSLEIALNCLIYFMLRLRDDANPDLKKEDFHRLTSFIMSLFEVAGVVNNLDQLTAFFIKVLSKDSGPLSDFRILIQYALILIQDTHKSPNDDIAPYIKNVTAILEYLAPPKPTPTAEIINISAARTPPPQAPGRVLEFPTQDTTESTTEETTGVDPNIKQMDSTDNLLSLPIPPPLTFNVQENAVQVACHIRALQQAGANKNTIKKYLMEATETHGIPTAMILEALKTTRGSTLMQFEISQEDEKIYTYYLRAYLVKNRINTNPDYQPFDAFIFHSGIKLFDQLEAKEKDEAKTIETIALLISMRPSFATYGLPVLMEHLFENDPTKQQEMSQKIKDGIEKRKPSGKPATPHLVDP